MQASRGGVPGQRRGAQAEVRGNDPSSMGCKQKRGRTLVFNCSREHRAARGVVGVMAWFMGEFLSGIGPVSADLPAVSAPHLATSIRLVFVAHGAGGPEFQRKHRCSHEASPRVGPAFPGSTGRVMTRSAFAE